MNDKKFTNHKCHLCNQINVFGHSLTLQGGFETQSMSLCGKCYKKINDELFQSHNYNPKHLKRSDEE